MTRRSLAGLSAFLVLVLVLVIAYVYGKQASCPPPEWWFDLFRQSGTYRCAG